MSLGCDIFHYLCHMSETKKEKTRNRIIEAGIDLLANNPTTSMEEIASSINLNRRTLHRYFKGKAELIEAIANYACEICYMNTRDCFSSTKDSLEQLKSMFISDIRSGNRFRFLNSFYDSPEELATKSESYMKMMSLFRENLELLIIQNQFSPELTLNWVESFYMATVEAAITSIARQPSNETLIMDMAWKTFTGGVKVHEVQSVPNE